MPRQERGVHVQASEGRQVENSRGQNLAVGRDHDYVGSDSRELRRHGLLAQGARLRDRQIEFCGSYLDRCHLRLATAPGGTIFLGDYEDNIVEPGKSMQAGYGKRGSTAEYHTHSIVLRVFLWRLRFSFRIDAAELLRILQVVEEERAVQVIDLVLEHPRQ